MNFTHGELLNVSDLEKLHLLLGGHPYLIRKALYLLSKGWFTFAEILRDADAENGPFGDHLCSMLTRLYLRPGLVAAVRESLYIGKTHDLNQRRRLIAEGVMKEDGKLLVPRCPLYKNYLARVLC